LGEEMRVINGYRRKIGKAASVGTFCVCDGPRVVSYKDKNVVCIC
jgi:hypothetical protein